MKLTSKSLPIFVSRPRTVSAASPALSELGWLGHLLAPGGGLRPPWISVGVKYAIIRQELLPSHTPPVHEEIT